ncbi:hypothetical protein [Mycobacterium sp. 1423905.2]|uniref:MmyB family transcriptional regulator n=1 Tax=Mycobacterium sp. 1423905.2 TaxID=1856859 RepID=UPI00352B26B7
MVRDLRCASAEFNQRWRVAPPAVHTTQCKTFLHLEVGEITVDCDVWTFRVPICTW